MGKRKIQEITKANAKANAATSNFALRESHDPKHWHYQSHLDKQGHQVGSDYNWDHVDLIHDTHDLKQVGSHSNAVYCYRWAAFNTGGP